MHIVAEMVVAFLVTPTIVRFENLKPYQHGYRCVRPRIRRRIQERKRLLIQAPKDFAVNVPAHDFSRRTRPFAVSSSRVLYNGA